MILLDATVIDAHEAPLTDAGFARNEAKLNWKFENVHFSSILIRTAEKEQNSEIEAIPPYDRTGMKIIISHRPFKS